MKIVNFYSYKGGVGRSLTLVNVAYQLSQKGQRIGLIDLDLEAGGLNHILKIFPSDGHHLLQLLVPSNRDLIDIKEYVHEIRFRKQDVSRLYLLPTISDSSLLDQIPWNEATQQFISGELLPTFGRLYNLDYILIDSRSGLSKFAALALRLADLEVLVFRLDAQNRYGIKRMLEVCHAASKPFKLVVSACPAEKRTQHLRRFEREIGTQVDCVLPYLADLYYDEFIVSKRHPHHKLSEEYLALATDIHRTLS